MTRPLLLALLLIAAIAAVVTHDRQQQELELAPLMWIHGEPEQIGERT